MDVRKPGTAAKLPAVIRITKLSNPQAAQEFPVFPPSYAGEGTNAPPVYDLNGIEWGEVLREKSAEGRHQAHHALHQACPALHDGFAAVSRKSNGDCLS